MARIGALSLILCPFLCLGIQAQTNEQTAPERPRAGEVREALQRIDRISTRYPDQVDSDHASKEDPVWVLDVLVKAEAKPEAWRKIRKAAGEALSETGLVPTTSTELERLPKNHLPDISAYLDLDGYHLAYRPKDQATFGALLDDIELLGDREVGRLGYSIRNCIFTVEAATFDFTVKGCWVKLRLRNLLVGRLASADGERKNGADGLLDTSDFASRKLATRLRALLDKGVRPE
jgi:hypothetical protein